MRWLAAALCSCGLALPVWAAEAPQVEVTLSTASGRSHFKAGEPLQLDIAFTARAGGVSLTTSGLEPGGSSDEFIVRAEDGGSGGARSADQARLMRLVSDAFTRQALPVGRTEHLRPYLNDWVSFDRPGRYTVELLTRRTGFFQPRLSNRLSLQIDVPSPQEVAERARELATQLRANCGAGKAERSVRELGWLGDAAIDAQLDALLNRDGANPCGVDVWRGLWLARDRGRVVQRLEQALDDPRQLLTARNNLLIELTRLRLSLESAEAPRWETLNQEAIRLGYVGRIADSLAGRSGEPLIDAAAVVLSAYPPPDSAEFSSAATALLANFDAIDPYLLDGLLRGHGVELAGPELRAGLHRVLDRRRDVGRGAALQTLGRLWPQDLAPYVLAEACAEHFVPWQSLAAFQPGTLPEADACLRRKLQVEAARQPRSYGLTMALQYVSRLASPALVPDVEGLLSSLRTGEGSALAAGLAYLVRWAPERYLPEVLGLQGDPQRRFMVMQVTAAAHGVARERLKAAGLDDSVWSSAQP